MLSYEYSPNFSIYMDEIIKELEEIETKYTPKTNKYPEISIPLQESLAVLSKELDSLGLPIVNVDKTMPEILEQVVKLSRDLVQIHQKAVSDIKEKDVASVALNQKHDQLLAQTHKDRACLEKERSRFETLYKQNKELKVQELASREYSQDLLDEISGLKEKIVRLNKPPKMTALKGISIELLRTK